jgi:predicted RNA-binding protein with PIN domain
VAPARRSRWPSEPGRCRWIVDGHNAIFAHAALEGLQTGDRKGEARRRLEQLLERFAARYGLQIQIVYDGNRIERNPDTYRGERVSSVYTLAPEEADDRIVLLAAGCVSRGERVVVVSSDRTTLGARLSPGVTRIEPSELYRRLRRAEEGAARTRPTGDFSDIEAHFLAGREEGDGEEGDGARGTPLPAAEPARAAPTTAKPAVGDRIGRPGKNAGREGAVGGDRPALVAKRERGRRKQERRLEQQKQGRKARRKAR